MKFEEAIQLARKVDADESNNARAVVLARALLAAEPVLRAAMEQERRWSETRSEHDERLQWWHNERPDYCDAWMESTRDTEAAVRAWRAAQG